MLESFDENIRIVPLKKHAHMLTFTWCFLKLIILSSPCHNSEWHTE